MKSFRVSALMVAAAVSAACTTNGSLSDTDVTSTRLNGATFEISDAAVYSNCLSLAFAVRGFRPPAGMDPQALLPPAKSLEVRLVTRGEEFQALASGGGGGGGGDEDDGRIWLEQRAMYSLPRAIPEQQEVVLEITAVLDEDFQIAEPLTYRVSLVAGPGGGTCP
jgi:hypothetical protein